MNYEAFLGAGDVDFCEVCIFRMDAPIKNISFFLSSHFDHSLPSAKNSPKNHPFPPQINEELTVNTQHLSKRRKKVNFSFARLTLMDSNPFFVLIKSFQNEFVPCFPLHHLFVPTRLKRADCSRRSIQYLGNYTQRLYTFFILPKKVSCCLLLISLVSNKCSISSTLIKRIMDPFLYRAVTSTKAYHSWCKRSLLHKPPHNIYTIQRETPMSCGQTRMAFINFNWRKTVFENKENLLVTAPFESSLPRILMSVSLLRLIVNRQVLYYYTTSMRPTLIERSKHRR